ncbi:MAG: SRPBCC family protein [Gemmataceae bacterium]|nr:SRPBCC family protein [Gemmataceae bacterium]
MSKFQGERRFAKPPDEVFAKLSDARFLVGCVPDLHQVKSQDERKAELVLRPGFAFIRGTLNVALDVVEASAETRQVRVQGRSKGIGSSADVEASLAVEEAEGGSLVRWQAEVKSLGGLLKLVPSGFITGAATKVINDAWDRAEKALA